MLIPQTLSRRKTAPVYHLIFIGCMVLSLLMVSCRKKKDVAETKDPIKNRTAGFLLRHYEESKYHYEWLGMKIDADFMTMGETQGFKATIRMRKDSAIWMSITPALGIEMIRILVTPDSLKYLSKIPDNKYYYLGGFEDINALVGLGLDFDMLQELLIGNAIGLDKDEGRFRSETEDDRYLLISKYRRKVRRLVGVDDRKLENDTIVVNPNDPRYQRTMRRVDEDEGIIVSRYWLESINYRMVRSVFNDLIGQRTMEIEYSDFEADGAQFYPSQCRLVLNNPQVKKELSFEITKLSSGKSYDFPFEIPEDYPRRDSL